MMDMSKMIFITGFARGGTSWLRDCVAFHPQVSKIGHEMVIFREAETREDIAQHVEKAIHDQQLPGPFFVNKAPANAPFLGKICRMLPEAKFLFIMRDPRDVFISHKRGTRKWMGGANSTVDGCMKKSRLYYQGFLDAGQCDNILLVRYEDLHQSFHVTLSRVYRFVGLPADEDFLHDCFKKNNFLAVAGWHQEKQDSGTRKGVIGDWATYLSDEEAEWYQRDQYWAEFLRRNNYIWNTVTYERILAAMREAGVHGLTQDDLLQVKLDPDRTNLFLLHDIDALRNEDDVHSVLKAAEIDEDLGYSGLFNFLPMDDRRYAKLGPKAVIDTVKRLRRVAPSCEIALHLNAAERFFPGEMEKVSEGHPNMEKAVAYLHKQVDDYLSAGVEFRLAIAHGYGRASKKPNNMECERFAEELERRGIVHFDMRLRSKLESAARCSTKFKDVGGALVMRYVPNDGPVDDPDTYRRFPPGTLIRILTHPGNYDISRPLAMGVRFQNNHWIRHAIAS